MRISALLLRRIHKWIGLLLGLQLVIWSVSGAMMALIDMEAVSGGARAAGITPPPVPPGARGWAEARQLLRGGPVTAVSVRGLLDRRIIEVATPQGVRLFDAASGQPVAIDGALAARIASSAYAGPGRVNRVTALEELNLAVREHELPIWQVDFTDEQNSSFYVSATTGRLLERRNDSWRQWDFFWMLHNMDYANRTSFNHPLIVTVAFGIVWLAVTGLWLLFRTAWAPDIRALRRLGRKSSTAGTSPSS